MELAIDTSTETACIVLSSQGEVIDERTWHAGQHHTVELMPNLVQLLYRSGSSLRDMSGIIVARGPGSFHGLRVGMSVAKGIAMALEVPLVGVSTLEVEALPYAATGLPICPILNAGRGEVATALFQSKRGKWQRLVEEAEGILGRESPLVKLRWSGTENLVAAQVMSTLRMLSGQLSRWFTREADLARGSR